MYFNVYIVDIYRFYLNWNVSGRVFFIQVEKVCLRFL